jgi:hypothetical protein
MQRMLNIKKREAHTLSMAYHEKLHAVGDVKCEYCGTTKTFVVTVKVENTIDLAEIQDMFDKLAFLLDHAGWIKDNGLYYCEDCKRAEILM